MTQDFETLNKQIAAFIIVSSAFAAPVCADGGIGGGVGALIPSVQQETILRYAGPGMGIPATPEAQMVVKYAGPGMIVPDPMEPHEDMIVRYAGPGINGEWPVINRTEVSAPPNAVQKLSNTERVRIINSADSVTAESSEDEHIYGEVKVAPGHFKFW